MLRLWCSLSSFPSAGRVLGWLTVSTMDHAPRKLALLLEYDGSRYHGFQVQQNAQTVQGRLEHALNTITGEANRLHGASRTDAGVHALAQVACFTTCTRHTAETFRAALNSYLPEDIAVQAVCEVAPDFDPRRHAQSRTYRYTILNRPSPSPLARTYSLWVREALDVAAMQRGAQDLVGSYDLASFSGPLARPDASTIRRIVRAEVTRAGAFVYFEVAANAFLPQQVRRTVGALLAIGRGQQGSDAIKTLRDHPSLGAAATVAPARGLCLTDITYPEGSVGFTRSQERKHPRELAAAMAHSWSML